MFDPMQQDPRVDPRPTSPYKARQKRMMEEIWAGRILDPLAKTGWVDHNHCLVPRRAAYGDQDYQEGEHDPGTA